MAIWHSRRLDGRPGKLAFTTLSSGGTARGINGNNTTNRPWRSATLSGLSLPMGSEIWFKWTFAKVSGQNIGQGVDNARVAVDLGAPPTISAIPNITVMATQTSTNSNFTVGDTEDGPNALSPAALSSSNEGIVPVANVKFGGTGANRYVYIDPAGSTAGTAFVAIQVTDSNGNPAQQTFQVTVLPLDYPPSISNPGPTNTLVNTPVTVPFTVGDVETPANSLTVSAQIATYSVNILANLTFGGTGSNRTVTVEPMPGADGVGVVTLSVTDGNNTTTSTSFPVMVRPASNVVFIEHFDYATNVQAVRLCRRPVGAAQLLRAEHKPDDRPRLRWSATCVQSRVPMTARPGWPAPPIARARVPCSTPASPQPGLTLAPSDVLVTNSNGGFVHLANNSTASSTYLPRWRPRPTMRRTAASGWRCTT